MKSAATAKILHSIYTTHPQLELTACHEQLIERAFVTLPHGSRELRIAMDQGPFGGLQGKADCVLYMFSSGESTDITNTKGVILQLLELMCELLKGSSGVELPRRHKTHRHLEQIRKHVRILIRSANCTPHTTLMQKLQNVECFD